MRVLHWSEVFWPYIGGAQTSGLKLLLGLRERGHEFIVVTSHGNIDLPDQEVFRGMPVCRFPFNTALADGDVHHIMRINRNIAKLKRSFAPDLIHINCFGPSVFFHLDTLTAHPSRVLVTLRGERFPSPARPDSLLEQTLRSASYVTAPSIRTVEYARGLVPGFSLPSSHIYNGMEAPPFPPAPPPVDLPRLLCLGRLVPNKGFDLALTAFAAIRDRYPHARMIIAGDGTERSSLERQATRLGVSEIVDFLGWISPENVWALINRATIVVVPSRGWEALPLVALEAAFMARPVVAARDGGLPEVVLHQKTGLLVAKEDSDGLARAFSFFLDHPEAVLQMGQAAWQRAQEVFSIARCVDAYDTLYRKLATAAPSANRWCS